MNDNDNDEFPPHCDFLKTTVFDHQHAATSWCGGQGHGSLTVRSQLLVLRPGTRFQLTSGTFVHTQRSAFCRQLKTYLFIVPD